MNNTSFSFYEETALLLLEISNEMIGKFFRAIIEERVNGETKAEFSGLEKMSYTLIKGQLDRAESKRLSGKSGGQRKVQADVKQTSSKVQANVKQSSSRRQAKFKQTSSKRQAKLNTITITILKPPRLRPRKTRAARENRKSKSLQSPIKPHTQSLSA